MNQSKAATAIALALAAAACGQGNSDNVMSPEANALEPADVNAALGPEIAANATVNDMNGIGTTTDSSPATTDSAPDNATEE